MLVVAVPINIVLMYWYFTENVQNLVNVELDLIAAILHSTDSHRSFWYC